MRLSPIISCPLGRAPVRRRSAQRFHSLAPARLRSLAYDGEMPVVREDGVPVM